MSRRGFGPDAVRSALERARGAVRRRVARTEELLDLKAVGATLHLPASVVDLEAGVQPRGYRLLSRIPRLPETVIERIVGRFGTLQKVMRATIDDLDDVTGVGKARARAIKEGLSRLAETSILDRYT